MSIYSLDVQRKLDGFIKALQENPNDEVTYLALADFLEEEGVAGERTTDLLRRMGKNTDLRFMYLDFHWETISALPKPLLRAIATIDISFLLFMLRRTIGKTAGDYVWDASSAQRRTASANNPSNVFFISGFIRTPETGDFPVEVGISQDLQLVHFRLVQTPYSENLQQNVISDINKALSYAKSNIIEKVT